MLPKGTEVGKSITPSTKVPLSDQAPSVGTSSIHPRQEHVQCASTHLRVSVKSIPMPPPRQEFPTSGLLNCDPLLQIP